MFSRESLRQAARQAGDALRARVLRENPHVLLLWLPALVLVLDVFASILFPYARYVLVTEPAWRASYEACAATQPYCLPPIPRGMVWDGILVEYQIDLAATLGGLFLFALPVHWVLDGPFWFPWQPVVWLVSVGSGVAVLRGARRLRPWVRAPYALALAILLSGFASYHWSTIGD